MADRPSVSDILKRARAGGPAQAESAPAPAPETAAEEVEAAEPEVVEAAAEPEPAPAAPAAPLGRPMTLAEKLAAARAGGAPKPDAAAKAAPAPKPTPVAETVEAAEPEAVEAPAAPAAPAAPLGRPMTLAEKLAAARAGGAKPAAAAPGVKPAAAAGAKPAGGAARTLPPLEKMSDPKDLAEALRRAGAAKEKAAKESAAAAKASPDAPTKTPAKPAAKPAKAIPPKPARAGATATEAPAPALPGRRTFLTAAAWVIAGWAAFLAGSAAFAGMLGRFMFPNVLAEPPTSVKVGLPSNFEPGQVYETWKAEWGFWIVRSAAYNGQDALYAIQSICTHLGCPPNWLAGEQKFKCPCHGSGFYISGVNFEGPAPRPLERFGISLADDGQVLIDKTKKFQEELGQWADPESFIPV